MSEPTQISHPKQRRDPCRRQSDGFQLEVRAGRIAAPEKHGLLRRKRHHDVAPGFAEFACR